MRLLYFREVKKIAEKYNIPLIKTEEVSSLHQSFNFVKKSGFPVVLRVDAPDIFHKTEKGLIIPKIENNQELKGLYNQLFKKIGRKKEWKMLIQKKGEGVELFFGAKKDKAFGAVSMFGVGGILVEVLGDISFSIPPLSKEEAMRTIKSIKGSKILSGYRNISPVNVKKLAGIFANFSEICLREEKIKEIDFNPVFAKGDKILVADPKIYVE